MNNSSTSSRVRGAMYLILIGICGFAIGAYFVIAGGLDVANGSWFLQSGGMRIILFGTLYAALSVWCVRRGLLARREIKGNE